MEIRTPQILNDAVGAVRHWDSMPAYVFPEVDNTTALKPMNCPKQCFDTDWHRSYRECLCAQLNWV